MNFSCPLKKQNEGAIDRIIRITVGISAFLIGYSFLSGLFQGIAYGIGVVGVGTGIVGYCGLYTILGISTCPIKKRDNKEINS